MGLNDMRKSYRRSAQALALMLVLQQAHALDVRGIRIGDHWDSARLEQALSYVAVPTTQRVRCRDNNGEEICVGTTRYLDSYVRLIVEGRNGRVSKMTMTLSVSDFENELAALKREYGQPTSEWSSVSAAAEHRLFDHRVDWRLATEELFALKFSTMATILLTTPEESVANQYPPPS